MRLRHLALLLAFVSSFAFAAPAPNPVSVKMVTNYGAINILLRPDASPKTVANFLAYVKSGFYSGTIFHRVIPGFMIQGGGFTPGLARKSTGQPVVNESNNGLHNDRGTIAMARLPDPDSATSQFFINLRDNRYLDGSPGRPGYTVFGQVTEGMGVVDAIAGVATHSIHGLQNVPEKPVIIQSISIIKDGKHTP